MTPDLNRNDLRFDILSALRQRLEDAGIRTRLIAQLYELRLPGFVVGLKFNVDLKSNLTATIFGGGGASRQFAFKSQDDIAPNENLEALVNRGLSIVNEFTILESRVSRAAFESFHPMPACALVSM